jgi:hypothetical protein
MSTEWLLAKARISDAYKDRLVKELPNEVKLHCNCDFEGIFTTYKLDFEFVGKDKKGYACFQCPKCKRHIRYDISTGKTKMKKYFFRFRPIKTG